MKKRHIFLATNVLALSIVSLLADLSTEMIVPILPLFLVGSLGASYSIVGLIEGSADSTSSLVKVFSGWYSDKFGKRKPFVVSGYLPTAILKPLLFFAQTPFQVFAIRIPERVGKGVRGVPRDALIAESVEPHEFGRAFGFHRAFDTLGAVIGSFSGFIFVVMITGNTDSIYREIFVISSIPAFVSVIIGQVFVKEKKLHAKQVELQEPRQKVSFLHGMKSLDKRLKMFLVVSAIFALANFNISFFILKAKAVGISDTNILLLYVLFNVSYAVVAYPFGILSDKIGRDKVVMVSFVAFILTCIGFAFVATSLANIVILFASLGVYMGIFDGSQKAYISEISSPAYKATALGAMATLTGIITLPASLIAGLFWDKLGSTTTFEFAAVVSLVSLIMFMIHRNRSRK
ncbi:MAG: MFS transporter [Nitrosotalea sp.]